MIDACPDPDGGYLVTSYDGSAGVRLLLHYDQDWKLDGQWRIPDDANGGIVRVTPRNRICLVSASDSALYLLDRPVLGPGREE